jgi:YHS domain-containing protein
MGLPCIQCKESFSPRHTFESAVYDEGVYFFCSKKCMDMWMSVNAQETHSFVKERLECLSNRNP